MPSPRLLRAGVIRCHQARERNRLLEGVGRVGVEQLRDSESEVDC